MIIEIVDSKIGNKINDLLQGMNYLYFDIDELNNRVEQVEDISKSSQYNYLVCTEQMARNISLI